ncbi:hypothetical protein SLU01_04970 [Sporosarcina luteola]|uniref:Uncharacterized protein n=1 Tax=Sporosarcina luteola TaxID=582850 RepID=A0A511Z411_9BACL|nr:hypothetical protein SLU01_04970 [Sporosarcina luteola]
MNVKSEEINCFFWAILKKMFQNLSMPSSIIGVVKSTSNLTDAELEEINGKLIDEVD